jgi:hypothetical protein
VRTSLQRASRCRSIDAAARPLAIETAIVAIASVAAARKARVRSVANI